MAGTKRDGPRKMEYIGIGILLVHCITTFKGFYSNVLVAKPIDDSKSGHEVGGMESNQDECDVVPYCLNI
jgi:hypothetical protein